MKLRLPLTLASAVLFAAASHSAPITSPVTGDVTATDAQTIETLNVGTADNNGNLTLNLGSNTLTVTNFYVEAQKVNGGLSTVTLNSGTLNITTGTDGNIKVGNSGGYETRNVSFTMNGGVLNTKTWIYLGYGYQNGSFTINGGEANVYAFWFHSSELGGEININGGRLNLGQRGIGRGTYGKPAGDNYYRVNFTGGTLGATENWSTVDLNEALDRVIFSLGDTEGDLIIDTKNPTSATLHTIELTTALSGTGGGTLSMVGNGKLVFSNNDNTFAKTLVLEEGTFGFLGNGSLGSAPVIKATGTNTRFVSHTMETITKDFDVAAGASLRLMGRINYYNSLDNVDHLSPSPLTFSGNFNLNDTGSLHVDNAIITIGTGQEVTGDKFSIAWNGVVNVSGGVLTFNTAVGGHGANLAIGDVNKGDVARASLNITNGGVFNALNASIAVSRWNNRGTINIESGGTMNSKGIQLEGYAPELNISNGTLNLGSEGIFVNNDATRTDDLVGKLTFNSGTIHASETASYMMKNYDADNTHRGGYFYLGNEEGTERILSAAAGATFTIKGLLQGEGGIVKEGDGIVVFDYANTYTGETEVRAGTLQFTADGSIASTSVKIHNGASITGAWTSTYDKDLTVIGNDNTVAALWGGSLDIDNLNLGNGKARLSVNGSLTVDKINVTVAPASALMGPMITLSGTNTLTLGDSINFIASNATLDQVGEGNITLHLINAEALSGIGSVTLNWNRDDLKYTFDTSQFDTTGKVHWTNTQLSFNLITATQGLNEPFNSIDNTEFLGAREPNVIFAESNTYTSGNGDTRLTNGYGNFTFQPIIQNTGDLYVQGLKGDNGKVILTNNANAQKSTKITDVTLVIDSSAGSSLLAPSTTPIGILGTGAVTIYGSTTTPGILELRTGGDNSHADPYLINNAITLNENTGITQTGANSHRLTGDLAVAALGSAVITNESARELIIASNINVDATGSLAFNADAGKIILTGAKKTSPTILNVMGGAGLEITNGYTVTSNQVNMSSDAVLSLTDGAILNLGNGGMTSGAGFIISGSTVNSSASSVISTEVNLTGNGTFNVANAGSTVRLEKGITGTGDLIKTGNGKLIVSTPQTSSTSGEIIVRNGHLQLGQASGMFMVDGQTPLTTSYDLNGDLSIESGTLSGLINAAGHQVHFGSGSVFALSMDMSNRSGSIMGAGNITVSEGATVLADILEQGWTVDTPYTIISSNTNISGAEFQLALGGEYAFVNVVLSQTSKNVILTLSAKVPDVRLSTPNEHAVFPAISYMVSEALDGRRGQLNRELLSTMQIVSKMTVEQLGEFVAETANSTASIYSALAGQVANTNRRVQSIRNRVIQLDPYLFDQYQLTDNRNIWVEGISNYSDVDSNSNAPGYRLDTWGGNLGVSFSLSPEAYMGVGFGYMSGKTRSKGHYGKSQTDSYDIDLFGRYKKEAFSLAAIVSGGFSHVDYTRNYNFMGDMQTAKGKSNGSQLLALVEAAYDLPLNESGTSILQPVISVSTGYAKFDGYDETGLGNAGYHVDAQEVSTTTLGAGLRYIYSKQGEDSFIPARIEVRAMVTQDVGDVSYEVQANYLGARNYKMNVTGVPLERTAFVLGASGVLPVGLYTAFFADVNGEFRDGQNGVSASVGINFQF